MATGAGIIDNIPKTVDQMFVLLRHYYVTLRCFIFTTNITFSALPTISTMHFDKR